jgi:uroporphyrinogen decarboxylase
MSLTPKERVLAAINHQEPDRVPIVVGVSNATGIKMKTYQALKTLIGVQALDNYIYDWPELGTAAVDEATLQRLYVDVRGVLDLEPENIRQSNQNRAPHTPYENSWGTRQIEVSEGEWTSGAPPMKDAASIEAIENYPWPDLDDPTRVAHCQAQAKQLAEENQYAIMGTPWLLFPFERAFGLQGMDTFLLNMAMRPDFSKALLSKITEKCKEVMGNFLRETGEYLDIIKIGDDLGTQESLMISPKMYREMLKPFHADLIAFTKERTDAKVLFHTDGDVFDLIDDFIEIGVDILNPIQTSAGRMADLARLKTQFGDRIVFCGGIDTHRILPEGTPDEVQEEVRRVINALGPGGGYMVASVHTIMNDVPAENVLAMVDAVEKYGRYPLKG